ncbi:hypothetical protein [Clostridium sp. JN-9]|uniref:hypothetical protein n=1 Tax=Clostridium sp. JN-9 TaxID=2507159 RepID=UPI0013E8C00A|nr:hypothetical protein [Clostridium sp. JN-9]
MGSNDKEKNNLQSSSKTLENTVLAYGYTGLGLNIIADGATESRIGKEAGDKENKHRIY